jgi:hypothetical protein
MRGWQSIGGAFRIWGDLMGGNYKEYGILKDDDPLTECLSWFWWSLGEDTVYAKEFLEYLIQLADDVRTGKVKTYSMDEVMEELKSEY